MTNTSDIDWSKAPEDTEFYCTDNFLWYKVHRHSLYMSEGVGDSWDESCLTVDDMKNDLSFIPRPIQQTIQQTVTVNVQMKKPPIGLMPKDIFYENMQAQRQKDIKEAMLRYIEAGKDVPNEWLYELAQLNNDIQKIETDFAEAIESVPTKEAVAESHQSEWIKNTQTESCHPPTLNPKTRIEIVYRDGGYEINQAGDWQECWNTSDDCGLDIVKYRIIGEDE